MDKSQRRAVQLGMPYGTASNKLRKRIIFWLLQQQEENICYRCGKQIETSDELSVDHKEPWEGVDSNLFWDLNNIAFSHSCCNRPLRNWGTIYRRKIGPENTAWCIGCKVFLPVEKFWSNRAKWNGLQDYCKKCGRKGRA